MKRKTTTTIFADLMTENVFVIVSEKVLKQVKKKLLKRLKNI